ncbi:hypothetical protein HUJ05_010569 [Dendroctonus ponderosae]|nr:hypothetical protein HUJ05_010569 [Dendroctonus ponderosae]
MVAFGTNEFPELNRKVWLVESVYSDRKGSEHLHLNVLYSENLPENVPTCEELLHHASVI